MLLQINDRQWALPESWNDCNRRTALLINSALMQPTPPWLDAHAAMHRRRLNVFMALTDLPGALFAEPASDEEAELREAALMETVIATTAPFFKTVIDKETQDESTHINFALTRNPYPTLEYKHRGQSLKLYGPADGLSNLSLYELGTVLTLFDEYIASKDESIISTLLATLYRPPKPPTPENKASNYQGDRRQPYRQYETTVDQRAKYMSRLPAAVRSLLLFFIASCRQAIMEDYSDLFTGEGQQKDAFGWSGLLLALADGLTNLNHIADQGWQNAFIYLRFQERNRRDQEARLKAIKHK